MRPKEPPMPDPPMPCGTMLRGRLVYCPPTPLLSTAARHSSVAAITSTAPSINEGLPATDPESASGWWWASGRELEAAHGEAKSRGGRARGLGAARPMSGSDITERTCRAKTRRLPRLAMYWRVSVTKKVVTSPSPASSTACLSTGDLTDTMKRGACYLGAAQSCCSWRRCAGSAASPGSSNASVSLAHRKPTRGLIQGMLPLSPPARARA